MRWLSLQDCIDSRVQKKECGCVVPTHFSTDLKNIVIIAFSILCIVYSWCAAWNNDNVHGHHHHVDSRHYNPAVGQYSMWCTLLLDGGAFKAIRHKKMMMSTIKKRNRLHDIWYRISKQFKRLGKNIVCNCTTQQYNCWPSCTFSHS